MSFRRVCVSAQWSGGGGSQPSPSLSLARCAWGVQQTCSQELPCNHSCGFQKHNNNIPKYIDRSVRLSVCMSGCLAVYMSVRMYFCLPVCMSVSLSVCRSVCMSVLSMSICLPVNRSACLSVCLSVCPSGCMSVCTVAPCTHKTLPSQDSPAKDKATTIQEKAACMGRGEASQRQRTGSQPSYISSLPIRVQ